MGSFRNSTVDAIARAEVALKAYLAGSASQNFDTAILTATHLKSTRTTAGQIPYLLLSNTADASNSYIYCPNKQLGLVQSDVSASSFVYISTQNIERMRIDSTGNVYLTTPALLGYGTGAGGTVTQSTSKSTAVTLNKPCGAITMHNETLNAGATATFSVNCSLVVGTDIVLVNADAPSNYIVRAGSIGTGIFYISIKNDTGSPLSEAIPMRFAVIKGAIS